MPREPDDELLDAMVTGAFEVMGVVTQVAAAHDVSLTQLRVLAILRDRTPRMSELASYLGLDRSTVSGLIDRAVARGFVERIADAVDGRAARVALTATGRALAERGAQEIAAGIAPLLDALSAPQRRQLADLLGLIGRGRSDSHLG